MKQIETNIPIVIPLGFEPKTHSLEGCCSIQLSYGTYTLREPKAPERRKDTKNSASPTAKHRFSSSIFCRHEYFVYICTL